MHHSPDIMRRYFWCLGLVIVLLLAGCERSMPPDVPEFKPPGKLAIMERVEPELAANSTESSAPAPEPSQPKPEVEQPKTVEAPKPVPVKTEVDAPPPPAEKTAPTLVGTWRVTDLSRNGQSMPEMGQMEMTWVFRDDNTLTMTMSSPQMPESHGQEGTYSVSDGQITISVMGQTKTGTYAFDGHSRVMLEMDEMTMVLARSS